MLEEADRFGMEVDGCTGSLEVESRKAYGVIAALGTRLLARPAAWLGALRRRLFFWATVVAVSQLQLRPVWVTARHEQGERMSNDDWSLRWPMGPRLLGW